MSASYLEVVARRSADAANPEFSLAEDNSDLPRSLVVVGVTGDGKSSTCNTLSGTSNFAVSGGFSSETAEAAHADYLHVGGDGVTEMRIIDTIGLHDTGLPAAEVMRRFAAFATAWHAGLWCFQCFFWHALPQYRAR